MSRQPPQPQPGESLDDYKHRRIEEIFKRWPEFRPAYGDVNLSEFEELLEREYRGELN